MFLTILEKSLIVLTEYNNNAPDAATNEAVTSLLNTQKPEFD